MDREAIAAALWLGEAERAAPSVAQYRTPEAFAEESEDTRRKWLLFADIVAARTAEAVAQARRDALEEAAAVVDRYGSEYRSLVFSQISRAIRALAERPE